MPAPPIRSTLCPSMGNWSMTVCHPRLRRTPNSHDSRSWPSQRCLGISVLLVHWTGRISSWCWLSCEHEAAIPPQATSGSPGSTLTRCLMPSLYLASTVSEERPWNQTDVLYTYGNKTQDCNIVHVITEPEYLGGINKKKIMHSSTVPPKSPLLTLWCIFLPVSSVCMCVCVCVYRIYNCHMLCVQFCILFSFTWYIINFCDITYLCNWLFRKDLFIYSWETECAWSGGQREKEKLKQICAEQRPLWGSNSWPWHHDPSKNQESGI